MDVAWSDLEDETGDARYASDEVLSREEAHVVDAEDQVELDGTVFTIDMSGKRLKEACQIPGVSSGLGNKREALEES